MHVVQSACVRASLALVVVLLAMLTAGCSREPRNEFLVRFECKFEKSEDSLPVVIDLERMRMALHVSSDSSVSVPLQNIGGELVFENDPRSDQSTKLWMRADGSARIRKRLKPDAPATMLSGSCRRG